jgi:hypothetical protein
MRKKYGVFAAMVMAAGGATATAQQPQQPPQPMSFFVTSIGLDGGNLGGLEGADKHCQTLATAAGAGNKTWRAYLSTQAAAGQQAVNARERIGAGPWFNFRGQRVAADVADLHGDTLEAARRGNNITKQTALTEKGEIVNGAGDQPNQHDILTGTQLDGNAFPAGDDRTCSNWTSNADGKGAAMVGHSDRTGGGNTSWNSVHPSRGCSPPNLVSTGGNGRLYCFAIN